MVLAPQEVATLRAAGQILLFRGLATPLIAAVSYGVSIPLVIHASLLLRSRTSNSRWAGLAYWGPVACLLFNSIHFAGEFAKLSINFDFATPLSQHANNLAALSVDLGYINDRTWNALLVRNWVDSFGLILSDAVVIWRTYVLLPRRQSWVIIPAISVLVASGTLSLAACVVGSTVKGSKVATSRQKDIFNTLTDIGDVLSLASNILATGVFGWQLTRLRRMKSYAITRPSCVQTTLWLLVESGVAFCMVQIATIVYMSFAIRGKVKTLPASLGLDVVTRGLYALSIIYPIMVVVLVRSKNSVADTYTKYDSPETIEVEISPENKEIQYK